MSAEKMVAALRPELQGFKKLTPEQAVFRVGEIAEKIRGIKNGKIAEMTDFVSKLAKNDLSPDEQKELDAELAYAIKNIEAEFEEFSNEVDAITGNLSEAHASKKQVRLAAEPFSSVIEETEKGMEKVEADFVAYAKSISHSSNESGSDPELEAAKLEDRIRPLESVEDLVSTLDQSKLIIEKTPAGEVADKIAELFGEFYEQYESQELSLSEKITSCKFISSELNLKNHGIPVELGIREKLSELLGGMVSDLIDQEAEPVKTEKDSDKQIRERANKRIEAIEDSNENNNSEAYYEFKKSLWQEKFRTASDETERKVAETVVAHLETRISEILQKNDHKSEEKKYTDWITQAESRVFASKNELEVHVGELKHSLDILKHENWDEKIIDRTENLLAKWQEQLEKPETPILPDQNSEEVVKAAVENLTGPELSRLAQGAELVAPSVKVETAGFWAKAYDTAIGSGTLGLGVQKVKSGALSRLSSAISNLFNSDSKAIQEQNSLTRFMQGMANGYKKEELKAIQDIEDVHNGKRHEVKNIAQLVGNVTQVGRVITDAFGVTAALPLRFAMMMSMAARRGMTSIKEARLMNAELIDKTRIEDLDEAWDLAKRVYDKAQQNGGKISHASLQQAYVDGLPDELIKRFNVGVNAAEANSIMTKVVTRDFKDSLQNIHKQLMDIQAGEGTFEEKAALRNMKLNKYLEHLVFLDSVVTKYGTVDVLAASAKYAETAAKTSVGVLTVESLYLVVHNIPHMYHNMMAALGNENPQVAPEIAPLAAKVPVQKAEADIDAEKADIDAENDEESPVEEKGQGDDSSKLKAIEAKIKMAEEITKEKTAKYKIKISELKDSLVNKIQDAADDEEVENSKTTTEGEGEDVVDTDDGLKDMEDLLKDDTELPKVGNEEAAVDVATEKLHASSADLEGALEDAMEERLEEIESDEKTGKAIEKLNEHLMDMGESEIDIKTKGVRTAAETVARLAHKVGLSDKDVKEIKFIARSDLKSFKRLCMAENRPKLVSYIKSKGIKFSDKEMDLLNKTLDDLQEADDNGGIKRGNDAWVLKTLLSDLASPSAKLSGPARDDLQKFLTYHEYRKLERL